MDMLTYLNRMHGLHSLTSKLQIVYTYQLFLSSLKIVMEKEVYHKYLLNLCSLELLIHYAGNDARINATWPDYKAALDKAGVRYQAFVYDGVEHGFNNDTTPRFDKAAADLAWARSLTLLRQSTR